MIKNSCPALTWATKRQAARNQAFLSVSQPLLFQADDLIQLMCVGYRSLSKEERSEFMRRVLLELNRVEHP